MGQTCYLRDMFMLEQNITDAIKDLHVGKLTVWVTKVNQTQLAARGEDLLRREERQRDCASSGTESRLLGLWPAKMETES